MNIEASPCRNEPPVMSWALIEASPAALRYSRLSMLPPPRNGMAPLVASGSAGTSVQPAGGCGKVAR